MAHIVDWTMEDPPASERRFRDLAKKDLPADWTVIHGLRIRQPPDDREIDFLVLDPARGALAIEVKGGRIERQGREWSSIDRSGERHAIKDPYRQASDAVYTLRKWWRSSPSLRGSKLPRLHPGVVFPDVARTRQELGPDIPDGTVLFSEDLRRLKDAIDRLFETHRMTPGVRLQPREVETLLAALAPPSYVLHAPIAARVDRNTSVLDQLTDEQARTLDFLERHRRAAIQGAAGTGKTVLAELKADRLAQDGRRVLLLCFNQTLAEWLASRASGFEARTFHAFCRERAQKAGLRFEIPEAGWKAQQEFWTDTAPDLLMEALDSRPDDRFDAIIVDEGQDFKPNWWTALELALGDEEKGVLYAFFDPNQDIYGGGPPASLLSPPFTLTCNCRNTRRIADHAAGLMGIDYDVLDGAPDGAQVELLRYRTPDEMVEHVRKQLHRLVAEEKIGADRITVLSTHTTKRSHLAHHRRLGNLNLSPRPQGPNQVRFTSLQAFKGLESDVVLLVDVDGNPHSCSKRHLYVAATRARALLIVLEEERPSA